jgi:hypothetical protein
MPLGVLLGAGAFRLLASGLTLLQAHNDRRSSARPAPAAKPQPAPQPTAVPAKVVATRVA